MTDAPGRPLPLPPGSMIGILGGGQLGRMLALAAARLGYRCHVFCPDPEAPASQVSARSTLAPYADREALDTFAGAVDVVTYEFENIPVHTVRNLARLVPVRPDADVLAICQDRIREKRFLEGIGVPVTPYRPVTSAEELARMLTAVGLPAVLKSARWGYDGKGQVGIENTSDAGSVWAAMAGQCPDAEGLLEAWVDFALEISVIVVRDQNGAIATYDPVENRHQRHVLKQTIAPAPIGEGLAQAADDLARRIAHALGLVGVLAVEMFVTRDGRLLVNELAPRPHNSGHWTIDACETSQFEQCVRAIGGLPLGSTRRFADAVMENLLGDDVLSWPDLVSEPGARLHLYGKAEARPGRKMGHVTRILPLRPDGLA
jgi:5-(carboxyamino)imidazole ribonucleotide synthase